MFEFNYLNFDFDGDGVNDSILTDSNNDGVADTLMMDTDGDGIAETLLLDSNGDGIFDSVFGQYDMNGDGYIDTFCEGHDYDQDGVFDDLTTYHDGNQDGIYEEVVKSYDSDQDGEMDHMITYLDFNGDGSADAIYQEQYLDQDGDGEIDTYILQTDADGDRVFEAIDIFEIDAGTNGIELVPVEENVGNVLGTYINDLGRFDPENADLDAVSGNPAQSMEEWEFQGDTGRCALYSQKFVIEELTGQKIDIEDFADIAETNGWFSEESGTPPLNMNKMLDYYGIENEMSFHNDISDIQECLESGGKVIVSVDVDEIWYGESNDLFTPGEGVNHAVEVIGIDNSNPEGPMVILNDSGNPAGCGEMVPLDTFLDAWEDGNCQMIACA